jgi:hypothetical protein
MIIKKTITIKTKGCRKIKYYKSLGYEVHKDEIEIKIEHISKGSRLDVDVSCDFCNKEVNIQIKEYFRNISNGSKYACCMKCGSLKAKETSIKKYGVDHPMMLKEIQESVKKTNIEKYGVEYLQQSKKIRKKSSQTLIDKYGVDHISKSKHFKNKFKETCLKNHGVEYPMMSKKVRDKSRTTNIRKYGVENPSMLESVRQSVNKTNKDRYGQSNYLLSDDFKTKNKKTMSNKWDSDNIMKSDIFRPGKFSISSDDNYIKYIDNGISLMRCYKEHDYKIHIDNYLKRSRSNLPLCTTCYPISSSQSIKEKELLEYITSKYNGSIIKSYRDGLEIDVYLPELNIGFEFNGLYWHSEEYKEKNYHYDKSKYFLDKGIRIIHIWEDDWVNNIEILKSQICNWLSISNKIGARKCVIKEIKNTKIVTNFLDKNHIQGRAKSSLKLGLYHNEELVSIMTFDHLEGRKRMMSDEWNLNRFCNKKNTSVIGGASKLLSYFVKNHSPKRLISYADSDWSDGGLYKNLGFVKIKETKPDYKYIVGCKRIHKSNYKKSNLNTNLTESKFMKDNNYKKIWDCGKIKFEKKY